MPRLTIDNREVEVPPGATVLDAARKLGIDVPTLCFLDGHAANTSCMICLVKIGQRWLPSCATRAEDGMVVESETPEVRRLRRTGLELLLSHHQGDCAAPCEHSCLLHMNVPLMLRQVAGGDFAGAMATIRQDVAMPAVLARTCGRQCERACRRREVDSSAAIGLVQCLVAEIDAASDCPYVPPCKPASGRCVAIIGAGPAALTAAYHLLLAGHACVIFDEHDQPGGILRERIDEQQLPQAILDREIDFIAKLGAVFEMNAQPAATSVMQLLARFDAVLVTGGQKPEAELPGVFATATVSASGAQTARLAASGKTAAAIIDRYLATGVTTELPRPFHFNAGRLPHEQIVALAHYTSTGSGQHPGRPLGDRDPATAAEADRREITADQARAEAQRCLHCECVNRDGCKLRHYAATYEARPHHYRHERRPLERQLRPGGVIYEPGKCILCGLCIQIAKQAAEPLGLTFVGRGFDVRLVAPLDRPAPEGLTRSAADCVRVCPTGALSMDRIDSPYG